MKTLGSLLCYQLNCFCILLALSISAYAHSMPLTATGIEGAALDGCATNGREGELFEAIGRKESEQVKTLLAAGVNPNAVAEINYDTYRKDNIFCAPALMHAAQLGDIKTVEVLLAAKANVNARDSVGKFVWAYAFGFNPIRRLAPFQLQDEMNARLQITKALLAAGANPDAQDLGNWNETAVFHAIDAAVMTGDLRILKTLLAAGAAINMKNNSSVAYAIMAAQREETAEEALRASDPIEVIQALLAAGANVNTSRNGFTALRIEASGSRLPGAAKRMKLLLAAGANVNEQYGDIGETPLIIALYPHVLLGFDSQGVRLKPADEIRNQLEVIKLLLAAGADPKKRDEKGDSPLHIAFYAYKGFGMFKQSSEGEAIFKALIAAGASLNVRDAKGRTVLMLASSERFDDEPLNEPDSPRVRFIKSLIAAGADVNLPDITGRTPLMEAILGQDNNLTRTLMAARANLNARDNEGATALLLSSASTSWLPFTRLLIEAGADVNIPDAKGQTPLMAAITSTLRSNRYYGEYEKGKEMIRLLIEAKADLNVKGPEGDTALMLALKADTEDWITQALLAAGANVNITNASGDTPLIIAAKRYVYDWKRLKSCPSESVFNRLIAATGPKVTAFNRAGESALSVMATKSGKESLAIIRALLAAGRSAGARGYPRVADLMAAIRRAAGHSASDIVQELITAGANVNGVDDEGNPTLIVAVSESGNAAVVRALLAAGARVNARDRNGNTALIAAVREYLPGGDQFIKNALRRDPEVIRALLAAGADAGAQDKGGLTALSLAKKSGDKNIIGLLEKSGARQ